MALAPNILLTDGSSLQNACPHSTKSHVSFVWTVSSPSEHFSAIGPSCTVCFVCKEQNRCPSRGLGKDIEHCPVRILSGFVLSHLGWSLASCDCESYIHRSRNLERKLPQRRWSKRTAQASSQTRPANLPKLVSKTAQSSTHTTQHSSRSPGFTCLQPVQHSNNLAQKCKTHLSQRACLLSCVTLTCRPRSTELPPSTSLARGNHKSRITVASAEPTALASLQNSHASFPMVICH